MKKSEKNQLLPEAAVIEQKIQETDDIYSLRLKMTGSRKFSFKPGQFNMLSMPGMGEAPVSFSSLPLKNNSFIHTIRVAGNVTNAINRLKTGNAIQIRGPFGSGWPLDKLKGKHVIVAAGGIGMAPLRPVVHYLLENRKKFNELFLIYGSKTEEDLLYKDELKSWSRAGHISVFISVDQMRKKILANMKQGLVTTLLDNITVPLEDTATFICGPEIMMRFVARQLILKGQNSGDIFISLERRMKCGIAHCGHCQIGSKFVCKDGPVFSYNDIRRFVDTLL